MSLGLEIGNGQHKEAKQAWSLLSLRPIDDHQQTGLAELSLWTYLSSTFGLSLPWTFVYTPVDTSHIHIETYSTVGFLKDCFNGMELKDCAFNSLGFLVLLCCLSLLWTL